MCIEVFWAICRSEETCCIFLTKSVKAVKWIQIVDLMEAVLTGYLLYLCMTRSSTLTLIPWAVILYGNTVPVFLRLLGSLLRLCGGFRLWTRQAFFCCRLWAMFFQAVVLMGQVALQVLLIRDYTASVTDTVPFFGKYLEEQNYQERNGEMAGVNNYNKLDYGFCVFCEPDECQADFEAGKSLVNLPWPFDTEKTFSSVDDYAHQGLTIDQCTYGSLLSLLPYAYWFLWQLHNAPSQGSLELSRTAYNSSQSGRRSQVASSATMATMISPMEIMGQKTAEKWFQKNTRIFRKVEEDEDDIPFYEVNKRKNATIDLDEEEAQLCAICQARIKNLEEVVELRCQHLYHKECARTWVLEKKSCPTCRKRQFTARPGESDLEQSDISTDRRAHQN